VGIYPSPSTVLLSQDGGLWLVRSGDTGQLDFFDLTGTVLTSIGSNGPSASDGTLGADSTFGGCDDLAYDTSHNIVVADTRNNLIRYIDFGARQVSTLAGSRGCGSMPCVGYVDDDGGLAQFDTPTAIALGPTGLIYVADQGNHRIRTVDPSGSHAVQTFAGTGMNRSSDGPLTTASFGLLTGIAVDPAGVVYVADYDMSTFISSIRQIADGGVTTLATDPDFNRFQKVRLDPPHALVTVDSVGNVMRLHLP
jgi:DNA-binding beta-propeller fold protein YncE